MALTTRGAVAITALSLTVPFLAHFALLGAEPLGLFAMQPPAVTQPAAAPGEVEPVEPGVALSPDSDEIGALFGAALGWRGPLTASSGTDIFADRTFQLTAPGARASERKQTVSLSNGLTFRVAVGDGVLYAVRIGGSATEALSLLLDEAGASQVDLFDTDGGQVQRVELPGMLGTDAQLGASATPGSVAWADWAEAGEMKSMSITLFRMEGGTFWYDLQPA